MSAGAPWSVKGIDPKAREVAKDLARRSGMTLGEWLNQMIMEGDEDDAVVTPLGRRPQTYGGADRRGRYRRLDDAYGSTRIPDDAGVHDQDPEFARVTRALEDLSARIEAAENRSTLAISGVDQAVSGLLARLESNERDQSATSARLEHVAEDLREDNGRMLDRLRQVEREAESPRSLEALRALETALGKIANQIYEGDARTRAALGEAREDIAAVTRRIDRVEAAPATSPAPDAHAVVEGVVSRVAERLEHAEARTAGAIRALEASFGHLDDRLRKAEGQLESANPSDGQSLAEVRLEALAGVLSQQVEAARAELIERIDGAADGRFEYLDRALADLTGHVQASEKRSAQAIESMGHEVLRIAHNLNGRMTGVEQSGAQAMQRAQGEMARMAQAVESRLRRSDDVHAQALERLGGEIGRISERLAERIAHAERRAAIASDDVGERIGRVADKLESRWDRASGELAERIRQSEERTARLLEEARGTIGRGLGRAEIRSADPPGAFEAAGSTLVAPPVAPQLTAEAGPSMTAPGQTLAELSPDASIFAPAARAEPAWEGPSLAFGAAALEDDFNAEPDLLTPVSPARDAALADPFAVEPASGPFALRPVLPASGNAQASPQSAEPFDEYSAETEFLADHEVRPQRPPVSTKEAIQAARAAARLGVRNSAGDDPANALFGGLKRVGGKSKLNERIERESRRDSGSTLKKALFASSIAAVAATCIYGYLHLVTASDPAEPAAPQGVPSGGSQAAAAEGVGRGSTEPLAAVAIAPAHQAPIPQTEAVALYQKAVSQISAGKPGGVEDLARAANAGYAPAQFHLASLYSNGEGGMKKDPVEARRWTERAADGGDRRAMFNLGMFWFEGSGGPQDQTQAVQWFRRSADQGLTDAQFNLAKLYEQGLGVPTDLTEAYKWYLVAAKAGDEESRAGATSLKPKLTPDQIARAEHAAVAFRAGRSEPADARGR